MDNLEEIDKFLETYNLSRLNQEEKENLNRAVTSNKIESVIKKKKKNNLPTSKSSGPDGFTGESDQIFQEELILSFSNFSKKLQRKECF